MQQQFHDDFKVHQGGRDEAIGLGPIHARSEVEGHYGCHALEDHPLPDQMW